MNDTQVVSGGGPKIQQISGSVTTTVDTTALATSAKQDTLLTELQLKADLTETQPVSLASVPSHAVTNAGTFAVQASVSDVTATGNITTQNLVPAGTATANSAILSGTLNGQGTATVQVTGTYTGALSLQATTDNSTWITIGGIVFTNVNTGVQTATITSGTTGLFQADCGGYQQVRVTGLAAMTGTATVTIRASVNSGMVALDTPLPTGTNIIGALSANQSANVAQINGVTPLMGNGVTGTGSQRVTLASDGTAISTTGYMSVKIDQTTDGTTNKVAATQATASNLNAQVVGSVASGSADSGNPVKVGGVGKTANPTAVTDGQRVNATYDKLGKQVVVGSIRDLKVVQQTTITSSTAETTIGTAVASTFLDLYGLIITNTSATVTKVTIKDSTAGTTRAVIEVPATETRGFMLNESAGIPQATVNNNWTATCGTSVAAIEITALFVKNI